VYIYVREGCVLWGVEKTGLKKKYIYSKAAVKIMEKVLDFLPEETEVIISQYGPLYEFLKKRAAKKEGLSAHELQVFAQNLTQFKPELIEKGVSETEIQAMLDFVNQEPAGEAANIRQWLARITKHEFWRHELGCLKIMRRIQEGDYILKGGSLMGGINCWVLVDKVEELVDRFKHPKGVPVMKIYRHFTQQTSDDMLPVFAKEGFDYKGFKALRLSYLVQKGIGQCTEMAIIVQLLAQQSGRESYWVSGFVNPGGFRDIEHCWNILNKDGEFFIFDVAQHKAIPIKEIKNIDGHITIIPKEYIIDYAKGKPIQVHVPKEKQDVYRFN
jgi:hypothetical protein